MKPIVRLAGLAVAAALLVTACGGGGDSTDDAGSEGTTTEITADAVEFSFGPDAWVVVAGGDVVLQFQNEGSELHTWVVLSSSIESEGELTEELIVFEISAEAGQALTISFAAPAAGTYQVICSVPGHFAAGMKGRLTVTDR
ncbi:MAG: plastocyanin/azurin family copper-binding protein [Acidimicrobiia bacterium]